MLHPPYEAWIVCNEFQPCEQFSLIYFPLMMFNKFESALESVSELCVSLSKLAESLSKLNNTEWGVVSFNQL
jgi:hypothetical protein